MAPVTNEKQPLLIPREKLIDRLNEQHQVAVDARVKAENERTASRQALLDAVTALTPDQVANIFYHWGITGPKGDTTTWLKEVVEEKKFVTEDLAVTAVETTLEKLIRILGLASNQEIEVYPSDELYAYI